MRSIGMDVHRSFAQIAVVEDGLCRDEGRIGVRPEDLRAWAADARPDDEVALEATTNTRRDRDDAAAAGAPGGGVEPAQDPSDRRGEGEDRQGRRPDPGAAARGGLPAGDVGRRRPHPDAAPAGDAPHASGQAAHPVEEPGARRSCPATWCRPARTPTCSPGSVGAGSPRRTLPADEWRSVEALLRQLDFHGEELADVDRDIAVEAIDDPVVARLMTVPGIDVDRRDVDRRRGRRLLPLRQTRTGSSPISG